MTPIVSPPRRGQSSFCSLLLACLCSLPGCTAAERGEACELDDADGVIGGTYRFQVRVDDMEFTPKILKVQNSATVTLELTNTGTEPHGFAIDCLATPNDDGCPTEACFEDASRIAPLEPGESVTVEFEAPRAEGIYDFRSTADGDEHVGQFVVQ